MDSDLKRGLLFELPGKTVEDISQTRKDLHRNLFFMKHSIDNYFTQLINGKLYLECVLSDEKIDTENLVNANMVQIMSFDPTAILEESKEIEAIFGVPIPTKVYVFIGAGTAYDGIFDTTVPTSQEIEYQTATETSV